MATCGLSGFGNHQQMAMESQMFFIYDHTVLQQETDLIKDAIIYFFPSSVTELTQWTLCGQLMGALDFFKHFAESPPTVFKLQHYIVVTKHLNRFTLALAGRRNEPTNVLHRQLSSLYKLFTFFHHSFDLTEQQCKSHQVTFAASMQQIWDSYLPFIKQYGDNLASVFEVQYSISLPKTSAPLFLKTSFFLEWCENQPGVLSGCIFFKNRVLCSHVIPELTARLLILRPQQTNLPCTEKGSDLPLPDGVRILTVYLEPGEYDSLLATPFSKTRKDPMQSKTDKIITTPKQGSEDEETTTGTPTKTTHENTPVVDTGQITAAPQQTDTSEITKDPCQPGVDLTGDAFKSEDSVASDENIANSASNNGLLITSSTVEDNISDKEKDVALSSDCVKQQPYDNPSSLNTGGGDGKTALNPESQEGEVVAIHHPTGGGDAEVLSNNPCDVSIAKDQPEIGKRTDFIPDVNHSSDTSAKDNEDTTEAADGNIVSSTSCVSGELVLQNEGPLRSNGTCHSNSGSPEGHRDQSGNGVETTGEVQNGVTATHKETDKHPSRSSPQSNIPSPLCLQTVNNSHSHRNALNRRMQFSGASLSSASSDSVRAFRFSSSTSLEDPGTPSTPGSVNQDAASLFRNVKKIAAQGNAIVEDFKTAVEDQAQSAEDTDSETQEQTRKPYTAERKAETGLAVGCYEHSSGSCAVDYEIVEVRADVNITGNGNSSDAEQKEVDSAEKSSPSNQHDAEHPPSSSEQQADISLLDMDANSSRALLDSVDEEPVLSKDNMLSSHESENITDKTVSATDGATCEPIPESCDSSQVVSSEAKTDSEHSEPPVFVTPSETDLKLSPASTEPHPVPESLPRPAPSSPSHSATDNMDSSSERGFGGTSRTRTNTLTASEGKAETETTTERTLVKADLYIQGNSDMLLLLLMEDDASSDIRLIRNLWKMSLPQLGELDAELKQCPEALLSDSANMTSPSGYSFLCYDTFLKKMSGQISTSGNPMQPMSSMENELCECAVRMHEEFASHADIRDVTLRNHTTSVYSHRTFNQEVFYQNRDSRPTPGLPRERDPTLCLDVQAYQRLWKDQGMHII